MPEGFRHAALLHSGEEGFVAAAVPFIRAGLAADEPVMVAVTPRKLAVLREALGADADAVALADMTAIGANPGRIIPAWQQFVDATGGRPARGIGEPVWPERSPAELIECQRHEALLNVAFADAPAFELLCPYDTGLYDDGVLEQVARTHPAVVEDGHERPSDACCSPGEHAAPLATPLPEPASDADALTFDVRRLGAARRLVLARAREAGIEAPRDEDLVLAVSELSTNSVRHGGGEGTLRVWREDGTLVCEVRDRGRIEDPLAGRRRPDPRQGGGYGLWLVHQVCDLVQQRVTPEGGVTRLHMRVH
jgi:anti-sigma regulatory factor (Ser/Thr protein kinase)